MFGKIIKYYNFIIILLFNIILSQNSYSQPELKYIDSGRAILKEGEVYLRLLECGNKVVELNSSNPWGYIFKAKFYIGYRPDSSLKFLDIAISLDENNSYAYHLRAMAKIQLKRFGRGDCIDAITDLNAAKKLDPFNPLIYNSIGEYYEYCDVNWQLSLKNYDKSIELMSNQKYTLYNRAWLKRKLSDTLGSLVDFNSAILLDSNEASFYDERGKLLFDMQKYQESYNDFNKSYNLGNSFALQGRAMAAYSSKNFDAAVSDFTSLLGKLSNGADNGYSFYGYLANELFLYRGLSYYSLGNNEMAFNDWMESSKMGNERAFNLILDYYNKIPLNLFRTLYEEGKYDVIISFIYTIDEKTRNNEQIIEQLANCYYMKENYDSSSFYYKKLLEFNPQNTTAKIYGGISSCNIENYELANYFFSGNNKFEKDNYLLTHYYKGITYYYLEKIDSALICFKKVEKKDNTNEYYNINWYLGQIYNINKNYKKSIQHFTKLIDKNITGDNVFYYRGISYYFNSQFDYAIKDFTSQIGLEEDGQCYYYRAFCYKNLGDIKMTCQDFHKAKKMISVQNKELEEFCK
jgi:tetratricopeptide (TPR) repeat protein